MNPQFEDRGQSKPIAYDANGQPLYAQPQAPGDPSPFQEPNRPSHVTAAPEVAPGQNYDPQLRTQYANEPGVVHATRQVEPPNFEISDEVRKRYEESKRRYPNLNISEGEFVILDIIRHPIGLLLHLIGGGIVLLALTIVLIIYPVNPAAVGLPDFGIVALIAGLLMALVGLGTFIAVWVYLQNHFYMTNESVIQEIQHSLFSRFEQTVSLGSIEDASFKQSGILQTVLNYGTIRLSTEGEETTYRFAYVANPRKQVAILNNAIESFKNGRAVDPYET